MTLALGSGEPAQAFPPAIAAGGEEPLAADLRSEGDGRRLGLLKFLAGLGGVLLGELVQRDARRRLRRVTAVTAMALVPVVALAVLAAIALRARDEAQRQGATAEGLVEFMLTALRERLKEWGDNRYYHLRGHAPSGSPVRCVSFCARQPVRKINASGNVRHGINLYVDFVQGQDPVLRLPVMIDPDIENKGNN